MGLYEILRVDDKNCDRKKPGKVVVWMIIAAIAFLAFGSFSAENKEKASVNTQKETDYAAEQEQRLEKILKKINGTGNVSVYIRLDDEGEAVTAKNERSLTEEEPEENKKTEYESETVLCDEVPYVVKEKAPQVAGVLVVAEGAADESVRLKIYEAVKALYGMPSHRIKVTY